MKSLRMQMGKLRYFCKSLDHTAFAYHAFETINIAERIGMGHRSLLLPARLDKTRDQAF